MADEVTTYSVTAYTGDHVTSVTPSASTGIETGTEVTLVIVCASGYRPVISVLAGGVTVANNKFEMGEADVVLYVTAEKANTYRVLERCSTNINGKVTNLNSNMHLVFGRNGAIKDVAVNDVVITDASVIEALTNAGLIEAI